MCLSDRREYNNLLSVASYYALFLFDLFEFSSDVFPQLRLFAVYEAALLPTGEKHAISVSDDLVLQLFSVRPACAAQTVVV